MFKKISLIVIFTISTSFNISCGEDFKRTWLFLTAVWVNLSLNLVSSESPTLLNNNTKTSFYCDDQRCVKVSEVSLFPKQLDSLCPKDAAGSYNPGSNGYILKK